MSVPGAGYDEIGTRTRQAWLRTGLGVVAVTLLAVRGLVVADAGAPLLLAVVVPAVAFLAAAVVRSSRLQHGRSDPMARAVVVTVVLALGLLALLGAVGALVGRSGVAGG